MEKRIIIDGVETNYTISDTGIVMNTKTNKEVKGTITPDGYRRVQLYVNKKNKSILTHKLVAEYFIENPENFRYVHHKNNIYSDNRVENLEWIDSIKKRNDQEKENNIIKTNKDMYDWVPLNVDKNYLICREGLIFNQKTNRIIKGSQRDGYRRITIDSHIYSIHRLVYETFVEPIPKGMVIDHIDGNKENNNLENLRCVTQSENIKNAYEKGHKGQNPVEQYDLNHNYIKTYPSCTAAAKEFNCSYRAISSAADRGGTSCGYYWKKVNKST